MKWGVNITFGTSIFALILIAFLKTKTYRKLQITIGFIILVGLISDLTATLIDQTPGISQLIFNIYTFIISICLWRIMYIVFNSKNERRISNVVFGFFLLGMILLAIKENRLDYSNGIWSSILALPAISYSFYYFFKQLNIIEEIKITATPTFWIFSGFLIYYGGTFVLTLFHNHMTGLPPIVIAYVWPIMNLMTILFHLTLIKAVWTMRKT